LVALVSNIAIYPFFGERIIGGFVFRIFSILILFSSLIALSQKKRIFIISIVLGVLSIIAQWNHLVYELPGDLISRLVFNLIFVVFVTAMILGDMLKGQKVTTDSIYGGICVYLFLGYAWALLYGLVEVVHPGSFNVPAVGPGNPIRMFDYFYFSYVTLTTLGYGDITPVSTYARSLAVLEAMTGVLYIAVFIARLIGMVQRDR
jgi:hypothetical protein